MAATSFQSLHKPFLHHHHHHHSFTTPDHSLPVTKPPTNLKLFSNLSPSSLTSTSTSPPTPSTTPTSPTFATLAHHLADTNFRQADEETRRLLIDLAGEAARRRGYVFFSEVQFINAEDLRAIDRLWRLHSGGKFGYSVQRRVWEQKARRDITNFFIRVGWMKKLETEVEQYNYREFPEEFIWELRDDTPEGHLPLTNALRGTQLLQSILTHPAFDDGIEEGGGREGDKGNEEEEEEKSLDESKRKMKFMKGFKPDYSF